MMDALVEATGKSRSFWTMQQQDRDPFRMDKEGNHRDAAWLRNRWDALGIPVGLHARGSCRNRAASCWPGVRGIWGSASSGTNVRPSYSKRPGWYMFGALGRKRPASSSRWAKYRQVPQKAQELQVLS